MANEVFAKLPEYIQHGLKKVAGEQGFTDGGCRFEFEDGSQKGDGFIGDLFKVFIREAGRDDLLVLCKTLPEHEIRKRYSIGLFHREVQAYTEVLPMLYKFQKEKGVGESDPEGFWNAPKCYYAYCDVGKLEGVVIMEDLREKGFRMWNKLEAVDFEHTRLMMIRLGKLHAISFAMKEQQPEVFERFTHLKDPFAKLIEHEPGQHMKKMFNANCERAIGTLDDDDAESRSKMQPIRGVVTDLYIADAKSEEANQYAVIGHGDCWINNVMYSYTNDSLIPNEIRLLDWQLCRYTSPVYDLMYFICVSTDESMRAKYYNQLLDIYYQSLGDHLRRLGGDPDKQFPRAALDDQLKRFGRFGLLISFLVLPMICTPNDEMPDVGEKMEKAQKELQAGEEGKSSVIFSKTELANAMYCERMKGLIKDLVRFGYL
ncbi:Juvenile hormone-inducible protein [Culex quinquefasciatus]|uniref:Juvenile hormone-inducible protein n=1 Tax=Culex quinquefasciatus TaxID=7176 RepID=B0WB13_CULQU|nr:Juvenile hormone-inducible protein [Culex quinquefasciatus]|eukprot:XP_001845896.1 Juvenile hormone-inducible protein [Culex quinquefasciatus]